MRHIKLLLALVILNTFLYASEEVPTLEEVAKLYVATFNRAPDKAGLDYWVSNSALPLSKIAQSFFDQPETKALYPDGTSNTDFITSVYQNLFNRTPDTEGLNYWENELNIGSFTKNSFIQAVINGAQNSSNSNDADILTNKTSVGLSFSEAGLDNTDDAKTIMSNVTGNSSSVDSALTSFGISKYVKNEIVNQTSNCTNVKFKDIFLEGSWNAYYNTISGQITTIFGPNDIWEFDCNNNIYALPTGNIHSQVSIRTLVGTYQVINNDKIRLNGPNGYAELIYFNNYESNASCFYLNQVFEGSPFKELWCKQP